MSPWRGTSERFLGCLTQEPLAPLADGLRVLLGAVPDPDLDQE